MTIIESFEELKKARDELIDVLCREWHIDKFVDMINQVCERIRR